MARLGTPTPVLSEVDAPGVDTQRQGQPSERAAVALRRHDPARRMARFYAVGVHLTLFGEWAVVKRWGRIDTDGQRSETWHTHMADAEVEVEAAHVVAAKRRRGYVDAG